MADNPVASDLSYQVLQRRRRECELSPPVLNELNRKRYGLSTYRDLFPFEDAGDGAQPNPKRIAVGEREQ